MGLFELLASVARDLEDVGVVYALTGSIASSLYGQPQMSFDADLGVRMTVAQADILVKRWKGRFYASAEGLREAIEHGGMSNVIDTASGWKIDLSVLEKSAFFDSVLSRRRKIVLPDAAAPVWVVSPEDVILMKLLWRRDSRSDKQFNDVLNVVRSLGAQLDWKYLNEWAKSVSVAADLDALRKAWAG